MKKYPIVFSCIVAVFLYSCEPITFNQPQPSNIKPLNAFPKRIQGKYISNNQASVITIADELMTIVYDYDEKMHKDSIGDTYKLIGDTLIDINNGSKKKIVLNGDTILQHHNWADTIFHISQDNILKRFKGYYFLNEQIQPNHWTITKIGLKNGAITVGRISKETEIAQLREITETTADTTSTHFNLSKRQFKNFVQHHGFSDEETYTRMRE
jgi:CRISPR/Cas system-associated protein Csx1